MVVFEQSSCLSNGGARKYCLLREHGIVSTRVGLQSVIDTLPLLHVHVIHLVDGHGISRPRSARRECAGRSLRWSLPRTLRWVHVRSIGTRRRRIMVSMGFIKELNLKERICAKKTSPAFAQKESSN